MHEKTKQRLEIIKALYSQGFNNKEIADSMKCLPTSVSYYMQLAGLENKIAKSWTTKNIYKDNNYNEIVKQIREDAQSGVTQSQCAEMLNLSIDKVRNIAKKENINFYKKGNGKYSNIGIDNFLLRLKNEYPNFEYISGYENDNSKVLLRCKKCNDIIERWASSVRSGKKFRCFNCERIARRNKELEKERQKQNKIIDKQLDSIQLSFLVCQNCGKIYLPIRNNTKYCSNKCYKRHQEHRKNRTRIERAKANGGIDYTITLDKLVKRDSNICYICNRECNLNDYTVVNNTKVAGNYYPSIDHVIPLAKGGTHSWNNVRLAHRICNSLKSDKNVFN